MNTQEFGFETRAVHVGSEPDPSTGAVVTPIHLATTFAQDSVGVHKGFEYSRSGNPTRAAVERTIASLEGATYGMAFASGLAAEDCVLRVLQPGDHVVIPTDAYGGTFRLIARVFGRWGISYTAVDLTDLGAVQAAFTDRTKLIWLETPTNPLLTVADIEAISAIAHERGAWSIVDNTFATPYLQQPLSLGADVVVHSTTKYLGGHSDVVGGFLATNDDALAEQLAFYQNAVGAVPAPFDCYMLQRGIKTLAVRLDRQCANALAIVDALQAHNGVETVLYPGLRSHAGHAIAARQMQQFGGMVSFTVAAGEEAALKLVTGTRLFTLAESLGAVESLIEHPGRMTHASVAGTTNAVPANLVRLSVGIETQADLVADLLEALDRL